MNFLMVFFFTLFWLDGRPGNEYFWFSLKLSGLLTLLTPLGVHPQCLLKMKSETSWSDSSQCDVIHIINKLWTIQDHIRNIIGQYNKDQINNMKKRPTWPKTAKLIKIKTISGPYQDQIRIMGFFQLCTRFDYNGA